MNNLYLNYLKFWTLIMILFVFSGIVISYSPVPWGDLWENNTYLLYKLFKQKDYSYFLNYIAVNHPIFFTKVSFVIDYLFFDNLLIFPLLINSFSIFLIYFLLIKSFADKYITSYLKVFILGFLFSWIQSQNFYWANQTQIWFNLCFSLISFYFYSKYFKTNYKKIYFSHLFSLFSSITFANGILVPLIISTLDILLLRKTLRGLLLLMLSILIFAYYNKSGSIIFPDLSIFFDYIKMSLLFFGNIFYKIFNKNIYFVYFFGALYIALFIKFCIDHIICKKLITSSQFFYFLYTSYYILSTIIIVINRWHFEHLELALSTRYTTFTFIAWTCLLLCYANFYQSKNFFKLIIFLLTLQLFSLQLKVFSIPDKYLDRNIALLSLSLDIRDASLSSFITKELTLFSQANELKQNNFGIFGNFPFNLSNFQNFFIYKSETVCFDHNETINKKELYDDYFLLEGSIEASNLNNAFSVVRDGIIVGFGFSQKNQNIFNKSKMHSFKAITKNYPLNNLKFCTNY